MYRFIHGLTALFFFATAAWATNLDQLNWLAGSWIAKKDHSETEEHWLPAKGEMMLAINRTVRAGRPTSFEFLRIEQRGSQISYLASPSGKPAVEFKLIELGNQRVVFENKTHDFPQRIIYWRESDGSLRARIEGEVQGKLRSQEWHFQRASN